MESVTFESLGLGPDTLAAIARKGFEEPTPIQALTIPRLLADGPDLIARARTGTGKTAAFGLPLVERLSTPTGKVGALILVPTRELALQVSGEILSLRTTDRPRVAPVYGGASMGEQLRRLAAGVDIVVGTPGRVMDHLERGTLDLSALRFLVLDEADEMLDMGFIEDIETIMEKCGPERRVVLFSATMPAGIIHVAKRRLGKYEIVEDETEAVATALAEQVWLEVRDGDKLEALCRIIDSEEDFFGIVFTATRIEADRISKALEERGYESEALHGDITQDRRERILARFRERRVRILVATDVAARGIDVERISHVVNWTLPHDPEAYVHRVGRTGRAGNAGTAITFVTPDEYRKLFRFKHAAGTGFKKGSVPAVSEVIGARRDRIKAKILARAVSAALVPQAEEASAEASAEAAAEAAAGNQATAAAEPQTAETAAAEPQAEAGAEAQAVAAETAAEAAAPEAATASPEALAKAKAEKAAARKAARAAKKAASPEAAELWLGLADELLARLPPREALAAALFESFGAELDPARYREIADVSVDAAATARLFVGAGRRDGATPRALAAMVKRLTGLPDRLVGGIEIYDEFSFLSVPFEAAERVIAAARAGGAELPPVRLATPKGSGPQRGSGPHGFGTRPPRGPRPEGAYPRRQGFSGPGRSYGPPPAGEERPRRPYAPRGDAAGGERPRPSYGAAKRRPKE